MKLLEIEIEDYKSIKKLKWNLDEAIVCLVGQNESGKSNLMEIFELIKTNQLGSLNHQIHTNRSSERYIKGEPPLVKIKYQVGLRTKRRIKELFPKFNIEERHIQEFDSLDAIIIQSVPDLTYGSIYFVINGRERSPKEFILDDPQLNLLIEAIREVETKIIKLSDEYSDTFSLPLQEVKANTQPNSALMKLIKLSGAKVDAIPTEVRQIDSFLKQISRKLNESFTHKYYSQDPSVKLNIRHNSGQIYLEIEDNSDAEYSMSERSNGFKYYISLLIEAASSFQGDGDFLFILDEPGNSLHPSGQRDLLRYLEELSSIHRVIYSTHSPFLINRLHPHRVKIVERNKSKGTEFKLKGFSKNWKPLRTALGMNISDSFYYSEKVLIVEGPEDVLYLSSLMHYFVQNELIDVNTDIFSFIDAGSESNLIPMVQIMIEEERPCVVLMDSDVSRTYNRLETKQKSLQAGQLVVRQVNQYRKDANSIEDLLPFDILSKAVNAYLIELVNDEILVLNNEKVAFSLDKAETGVYKNHIAPYVIKNFTSKDKTGDDWIHEKVPISKVGIARQFEKILASTAYPNNKENFKNSMKLISDMVLVLKLKNTGED
jgi:predicted ATP-dependent endonuclease of OLD family